MLSCLPYRPSDYNDDNELSGPDMTDKLFEINMINNSSINPTIFAQHDHQITENQCTKEELNLPLKLSVVNVFYWIMYFTTYQRLTQIQ